MLGKKHIDYVIVGQGLAGSAVALQLLKRQKKILVIDRPCANSSSRVAAGLFNPVTGRNLVKTWMADQLFPYFQKFYQAAEALTRQKFFHQMPLYRPFGSIEEQNEWMAKSADPIYQGYVREIYTHPTHKNVKDVFGGLMLNQCGYLDTIPYLEAVRTFIKSNALFLEESLDDDLLEIGENSIRYKGHEASNLIFCQGIESNQWFKWVPILPLKGETIRIESHRSENIIINRGVYAVPVNQKGTWRVGATYSLTDNVKDITDQARAELTSKMDELVSFPYTVVDQEWGIRPTTHDRKPVLGQHPEHKVLYIFNGLGPKGVSLAPYFSEILVQSIENHQSLNKEVNIERYKLLYWSPSTRI
ncbi:FAD-dependent oxidoreductase [Chryseolinea sp. H1M3-3]|uniref:NAD(P)/FAD-dependent oxidoreductase n=1 Tax=Chryseolinea sp. H1M3-3 TaxID=3034144 RepID=UPI0023EDE9F7|nr:FAD-dependent oxidoreductase [Chryseolinea sp. H1M3-3]